MPETPAGGDSGPSKIIVDSDWKAQAQREREKLATQEREAAAKKSAPRPPASGLGAGLGGGAGGATPGAIGQTSAAMQSSGGSSQAELTPGSEELEPADFRALVGTLATQALMYMGAFPDPQTGRAVVSLEYARFHLDLLVVLEEKSKGNLSEDEQSDLRQVLNELRMRFVEIVKAVAQAAKEGRVGRGGPGGAAGGGLVTGMGGMGGGMGMGGGGAGGMGGGYTGPGF